VYDAIVLADVTDEERVAAQHLRAAGDIIIVVLSFTILFAAIASFININIAFRYDNDVNADQEQRSLRGAQVLGFLAWILELLAIIFWITIFPYQYARDIEVATWFQSTPGFVSYLTLGVGFSIQIGGFIVAGIALAVSLYGFFKPASSLPAANRA